MIDRGVMSYLTDEIASQPGCWSRAIGMAGSAGFALPEPGERVAAIGCGSSLNVARCYAALREAAGQGETDAFPASEVPAARRYDRLLYISRTGTTTEVLDALRRAPRDTPATAITADPDAPLAREARHVVLLDFADERSVSPAGSSPARSFSSARSWGQMSAPCRPRPSARWPVRCHRNWPNGPSSRSSDAAGPPRWPTKRR
jgi:fructoselysine-6-P-deglycase FrlB-like protein